MAAKHLHDLHLQTPVKPPKGRKGVEGSTYKPRGLPSNEKTPALRRSPHIVTARSGSTVERRTSSAEVSLAYGAAARDAWTSERTFSKAERLANELRQIYRDGWGVLDDDQHGRALFSILLHTIANTGVNLTAKMDAARQEFPRGFPMKRC